MKIKSMIFAIPFFVALTCDLESAQVKGSATVELPKRICNKDGRPKDKKIHLGAIESAKKIAWNNFVNTFSREKIEAYNSNKESFMNNFSNYVDDNYRLIYAECNNDTRTYTVVINATINDQQVNADLRDMSAGSEIRSDLQGKAIIAMVIPRQTDSADIFDDKVNKQVEVRKSAQTDASLIDDGTSISSTESTKERSAITTGGKTTRKATQRTYKIGDLQSSHSQIVEVLRPFGMRVLQPTWLERQLKRCCDMQVPLKDIYDEFSGVKGDYGANINPGTQDDFVYSIIENNYNGRIQVEYFIIGTVDTSVPKVDYDTGNYSADVLVNLSLYKIDMDYETAEVVATVGPEIKTAFGSSDVVASNMALKKTFNEAINALIYKL